MENVYLAAIGWPEILLILAAILILFGATKIPQLMKGLGQGVSEFKKGLREGTDDRTPLKNKCACQDKKNS